MNEVNVIGQVEKTMNKHKRELKAKITENGIRIYQDNKKKSTASEFRTFQKVDTVCNSIMAVIPSYIIQNKPTEVCNSKKEYNIIASRGRKKNEQSPYEQKAELNKNGVSNTLTEVQKDNLVLESGERMDTQYRIRKLTPRECGRLMGVRDSDIDKMMSVNSNSQLYKQFGNSIVIDVMCAMFRNLL